MLIQTYWKCSDRLLFEREMRLGCCNIPRFLTVQKSYSSFKQFFIHFVPADIFWHGRFSSRGSCTAASLRDHDKDLWPDAQTAVPHLTHQPCWTQTHNWGRVARCHGPAGTAGIQGEPWSEQRYCPPGETKSTFTFITFTFYMQQININGKRMKTNVQYFRNYGTK